MCLGLQKQRSYKEAIQQIVFWNIENGGVSVILKFKLLFLCLILTLPLLAVLCWAGRNVITCTIKQ